MDPGRTETACAKLLCCVNYKPALLLAPSFSTVNNHVTGLFLHLTLLGTWYPIVKPTHVEKWGLYLLMPFLRNTLMVLVGNDNGVFELVPKSSVLPSQKTILPGVWTIKHSNHRITMHEVLFLHLLHCWCHQDITVIMHSSCCFLMIL